MMEHYKIDRSGVDYAPFGVYRLTRWFGLPRWKRLVLTEDLEKARDLLDDLAKLPIVMSKEVA